MPLSKPWNLGGRNTCTRKKVGQAIPGIDVEKIMFVTRSSQDDHAEKDIIKVLKTL